MFKERTWTKLLKPIGDVYECIIKGFFANAFVEGYHINCWVREREFTVSRESIQELLEIRLVTPDTSLQFDERKKSLSLLRKFMEVSSRRRPCTRLSSLWSWGHWPISWSSNFIQWRIWQYCQGQGPFFSMISSLTKRLIFVVTSTITSSSASTRHKDHS